MPVCFFATDLHGKAGRYETLFDRIAREQPEAVFLGGDLLPHSLHRFSTDVEGDFIEDYLVGGFRRLCSEMKSNFPQVFLILGNDDPRCEEEHFQRGESEGLWKYVHGTKASFRRETIYGLNFVPPTPFLLKDWERYDVSRYVPPGSVSPEEGRRTAAAEEHDIRFETIETELQRLAGDDAMERAVFLLHTPPSETPLDRAALDGKSIDHVPLDLHVGSIAVKRFIEKRQPLLTLHGHIHESTRVTGQWKIRIGRTVCVNGAHDGAELALIHFQLDDPASATRELI